jgi:hypothetical protein
VHKAQSVPVYQNFVAEVVQVVVCGLEFKPQYCPSKPKEKFHGQVQLGTECLSFYLVWER